MVEVVADPEVDLLSVNPPAGIDRALVREITRLATHAIERVARLVNQLQLGSGDRFRGHHTQLLTVGCGLDSLRSWPGWHAFSHLVCPIASLSEETVDREPPQKPGPKGRLQSEVGVSRNSDSPELATLSPELSVERSHYQRANWVI